MKSIMKLINLFFFCICIYYMSNYSNYLANRVRKTNCCCAAGAKGDIGPEGPGGKIGPVGPQGPPSDIVVTQCTDCGISPVLFLGCDKKIMEDPCKFTYQCGDGILTAIEFKGKFTGSVVGNVTGDVTGNVTGNLIGNSSGVHTGSVVGNVTGDVTGNVTGNLIGNSSGVHTGSVVGNADTATTASKVGLATLGSAGGFGTPRLWVSNGVLTWS
jgi:hypothetical protein